MRILRLDRPGDVPEIRRRLAALAHRAGGRPLPVIAGTSLNALGVVRALGAEGIPTVWLTSNPSSFVTASRFSSVIIQAAEIFSKELIATLCTLAPLFPQRPALFLTHDFQVKEVSDQRELVGHHFRFMLPPPSAVDGMLHKAAFHDLARASGLQVPRTVFLRGSAALSDFLADEALTGMGWVIKPATKDDAFERYFGKALRIEDPNQWSAFRTAYAALDTELVIQQWIPGGDDRVVFCLGVFDEKGAPVGTFCGRKIRQYKPEVGNTASAEPTDDPATLEQTVKFFERQHVRGMASLEFKRDRETGALYVIEPTIGRTDLQSELPTVNGCNLTALYYYLLADDRPKIEACRRVAPTATRRRAWVRGGPDFRAARYFMRRGELPVSNWLKGYLRPLAFAVFRLNDPMPFCRLAVQHGKRTLFSTLGRAYRGAWRAAARRPAGT